MARPGAANFGPGAARAVEAEVRGNVLAQKFGPGTVADLALPEGFVRRVCDRVIIDSFNERFRAVQDTTERPAVQPPPTGAGSVRILRGVTWDCEPEAIDETRDIPRNYGGPRSGAFERDDTTAESGARYEQRRARELVTRRLARDGVMITAMEALRALGKPGWDAPAEKSVRFLKEAGVPVDLLEMFELPGQNGFVRGDAAEWIAARVRTGELPTAIRERLAHARLVARASLPGFQPTDDAGGGSRMPLLARLQVTRGDDWLGEGDGGSLDIARQIAALMPEVPLLISAHRSDSAGIAAHAAAWMRGRSAPITLIEEGLRVSQWAQDNARGGTVLRGTQRTPAALLPRYASRADELSACVPGDTLLTESLAAAGIEIARSSLHFQGGNVLVVEDRAKEERILLLGEAEVYRNIALGLTREQTVDLFCAEFAAARCIVLPAVSYHIDYELFVRAGPDGRPTAFVADGLAGAAAIVDAGIDALVRAGRLDKQLGECARDAANSGDPVMAAMAPIWAALSDGFDGSRGFSPEVAAAFSTGSAADPGAANLAVFLDALDSGTARSGVASEGIGTKLDGHTLAMLVARRRVSEDRALFRAAVEALGWPVVSIPSYPSGKRGLTALNAVNAGPKVLSPAASLFFSESEDAARKCFSMAASGVSAVRTAESQRRHGAVRCALSLYG